MNCKPSPTEPSPAAREATWYDEFYQEVQRTVPPWYAFMIPHLEAALNSGTRLLELGCGQGHLLRYLSENGLMPQENLYGIDQSKTTVDFLKSRVPRAHIEVGDIYRLNFKPHFFDVCVLMETIEHLEWPAPALAQVFSVVAPGGLLYISFPNFLHLPWLVVRILAKKLNRPNWIVLQPVDKIYTVMGVLKLVRAAGFRFEKGIGSNYGPPVLYPLEKAWMTRLLNALGLWWLSFHPILVFRKPTTGNAPPAP